MEKLKEEIKEKVDKRYVYEDYPCSWRGVVDGKPMVGGLEEFGKRVLDDLWDAVKAEVSIFLSFFPLFPLFPFSLLPLFPFLSSSFPLFPLPLPLPFSHVPPNAIRQFPEEDIASDALARARSYHETFIETHARQFVGRSAILKQLHQFVEKDTNSPCVVIGEPGGGKSSLVAAFAREYIRKKDNQSSSGRREGEPVVHEIICHFVGAAPMSTNIRHTLDRLCKELRLVIGKYDVPDTIAAARENSEEGSKGKEKGNKKKGKAEAPEEKEDAAPPTATTGEDDEDSDEAGGGEGMEDYKSLKDNFAKYLERAGLGVSVQDGGKKRLVLIIDALNQLDEAYSAHNLDWLPRVLPKGKYQSLT